VVRYWGEMSAGTLTAAPRLLRLAQPDSWLNLAAVVSHGLLCGMQKPKSDILVMMNACFGQGEPTDNSKALFNAIMSPETEKEAKEAFSGRRFAVFGLGSTRSHMAHYQVVGRALDARLEALGGVRVVSRGEGDDSGSLEDDFDAWALEAVPLLKEAFETGDVDTAISAPLSPPPVSNDPVTFRAFDYGATAAGLGLDVSARISQINRLCPEGSPRPSFRVRLERVDRAPWDFTIGDHVVLLPHSERQARRLAAALGETGAFAEAAMGIEFSSPVPRSVMAILAQAASGHLKTCAVASDVARVQTERLASLAAPPPPRGSNLPDPYMEYARSSKEGFRGLVEVVVDHQDALRGALLPRDLAAVLEQMPRLRTRSYSVASSPISLGQHGAAEILVRRVSFATPHESQPGACSAWVTGSEAGPDDLHPYTDVVRCSMRSAGFALPATAVTPLVLIAGGVGIAPFAGFWHHRRALRDAGAALGPALLIRCAASESDLLLRDEVEWALQEQLLSDAVDVVFEGGHVPRELARLSSASLIGKALLEETTRDTVRQVLSPEGNGQGFVCGGAAGFGRAVAAGVQELLEEEWGLKRAGDDRSWPVVEALVKQGRWHEDLAD
jgi:sulfite reductase alpha subunit-like flavoprotein